MEKSTFEIESNTVKVDLIPEAEIRLIARTLLPLITKYFENPENKESFEKWQKERRDRDGKSKKR